MAGAYRRFVYLNRRENAKIVEIQRKIQELQFNQEQIRRQLRELDIELTCRIEIVDRLEKWIEMVSDGAIDNVHRIREELQSELLVNEQLLAAAQSDRNDDEYRRYLTMRKLEEYENQERLVEIILEEVFVKEMRLRCIRAMIKVVENELSLREKHKAKMDDEIEELKQSGKNEIRLRVIAKQRDVFGKTLENCEKIRRVLSAKEEKKMTCIADDQLTIEKMREFRYKVKPPVISKEKPRHNSVLQKTILLKKLLEHVNEPVDRWKNHLCHWKSDRDNCQNKHRRQYCESTEMSVKVHQLFCQLRELQDEQKKDQERIARHYERYLESKVEDELSVNKQLILEFEVETKRLEEEALQIHVPKTDTKS